VKRTKVDTVEKRAEALTRGGSSRGGEPSPLYLPTGCAILNCALSGRVDGGFPAGKIGSLVGDSQTGKSLIALDFLANLAGMRRFEEYELVYDDAEHACEFDLVRLFGKRRAERIMAPRYDKEGGPVYSDTMQDWMAQMMKRLHGKTPFVYVIDSLDSLDDEADRKKLEELADSVIKKEAAPSGTYGTAKAKNMSWYLRTFKADLKHTNSFLLIISQTRENIGAVGFGAAKKTRSGGMAPKFYSTHEMWISLKQTLKSPKKVPIGLLAQLKFTKNKLGHPLWKDITIPMYQSYGVDSISPAVDWLVSWGTWKKVGNKIDAKGLFKEPAMKKSIVQAIEKRPERIDKLYRILQEAWNEMEEEMRMDRKPKYAEEDE
jgi:RecA/RadA recombinase